MKIDFDDKSYVELILSAPGKVAIILGAKDGNNPLNTVVNSAEITLKQLAELVADLNIPLPLINKNT
jgi:hypothetical protein